MTSLKSVWDLLLLLCLVLKFSCERFEHALGHGPCQVNESCKNLTNGVDSIRNGHQRLFACEVLVFLEDKPSIKAQPRSLGEFLNVFRAILRVDSQVSGSGIRQFVSNFKKNLESTVSIEGFLSNLFDTVYFALDRLVVVSHVERILGLKTRVH